MAGGRKGKFAEWLTEDGLTLVEGWAREGANDEELAAKIGIGMTAFYEWQKRFPKFAEAIKKGKAPVDFEVENALLKAALGYTVIVKEPVRLKTKKQLIGRGTIEEERVEVVEREIYIKPDITAQIFWLKNRKAVKWRDKPEPPVDDDAVKQARVLLEGVQSAID